MTNVPVAGRVSILVDLDKFKNKTAFVFFYDYDLTEIFDSVQTNPSNPNATINPVTAITNYEYEVRKNEDKRGIYILKPEYLQLYLNDMRRIMYYEKSSQFVNRRLVQTENTRNTSP